MPPLVDVYAKFGETAEASQLLETELGNLLLEAGIARHNLLAEADQMIANELVDGVNRKTLG